MKEKILIALGLGVSALVAISVLLYLSVAGNLEKIEYIYFVLIAVIVAGSTILFLKKTKAVKAGLPVDDELAKKVAWKAGYYTYIATIWLAVSILWYNGLGHDAFGFTPLTVEMTVGVIVLVSGVIFLGLAAYFNQQGDI